VLKTSAAVAVAGVVAVSAMAIWELVAIYTKASVSINTAMVRIFFKLISEIIYLQLEK
jgi:hypothetical protein